MTKKHVHFVGVGGIGMSSLARWYLAQNWAVSGSDLSPSEITKELEKEGVRVKIGHNSSNLPQKLNVLVYSNALPQNTPEIEGARKLGASVVSYSEALGAIAKTYTTLAVAGSHGKSTTTALLGLCLLSGGFDPTVIVGTKVKEFGGKNFRFGGGKFFALEADEYKGAFFQYVPTSLIITNIDKEHLDFYKTFANVKRAFLRFLGQAVPGGKFVFNRDDAVLWGLRAQILRIAKTKHSEILWYSLHSPMAKKIERVLRIPGRHNVSNALAVYTLARALGVLERRIFSVFRTFSGTWRRMEYCGDLRIATADERGLVRGKTRKETNVEVYDDYAHHPTEIKATLSAFKQSPLEAKLLTGQAANERKKRKIVCVFQPHQAHRLKSLFKEFVDSFQDADGLILLPTYQVPGRDIALDKRYSSEALAKAIIRKYPRKRVLYLEDPKRLKEEIFNMLRGLPSSDGVLVMMGAGDIFQLTSELIKKRISNI
ncbi:UDP-N-acetylmuramate--L-alanine ligase [Candidatus Jorgensenbacteria bacterium RIFCSPLOWO2_01_FULL_45_25b]|uniref:UDP-N-acetylmuramate--L-alanine ligase n=1 Tax=Candidatus Jorgensenbacteria bacterium RIFCSPLOWO2_01_FULL_45_25b TaxID=1798471 RepID=A0A1F6BT16_9BACT|nr:MAG: UDP-N-acetylmuramate--L-alanine ligase [Candidatus Jorgensenbacteria bacterium RIFCSPLOWO2_01_FULL_45_25b]